MKIGLFFGSFNPIHVGHLIIGESMLEHAGFDQVWYVVSPQNPFKSRKSLLHEFDRYDMVVAAVEKNDRLSPCDVEFRMPKPSYTVDTLAYLGEKHPNYDFSVIIGGDNLSHFHKWKNHEVILEKGVVVYPRPGAKPSRFDDHPNVRFIDAPMVDISATFIRENIREGKSIRYLVTEPVMELIDSRRYFL
ncbi:putative nicotinate-nucleotide adenylyltransferase [Fulvitalea axinellae]|uniref:Probable nicotinate-nucleotide adenylyltransferase n=1 Tax=Fulvitalea axinellae TaxID=1182444 RepID=A0AAU9CG98_9BACT|nr:putative nicotinate-nucleotide adenylyltransferase [Fulvitalea axinellae]